MTGRPSSFTQEIADEICARVVQSDYGLEQVCEEDDMPSARTVFRWLAAKEHESFRQQYARAKELQGHVQADRGTRDALQATDAGLGRLKFDARKWQASKLASRVYGDKVALTGADGGAVQFERIERRIVDPMVSEKPGLSRPSEAKSPNTVD